MARNAHGFQRISQHGTNLRVCGNRGRAHGVGVTLVKLTEAPGTWFFIAPNGAKGIAAIGAWQIIAVLCRNPRQGSGQIIAQRKPVGIFILPAKHTFIRSVNIG